MVNIDFSATKQSSLSVVNEISLQGGRLFTDVAHISAIENDFSESVIIPEPLTMVLIGGGLLAFGIVRRRKTDR